MILIDTTVIVDMLRGIKNEKTDLLKMMVELKIPHGISILTYQEVLQGAKGEQEYLYLQTYLESQRIYYLPETTEFYDTASRYRMLLRERGITPPNTVDILIATTSIWYGLKLLHNDKDFTLFAKEIKELEIYK